MSEGSQKLDEIGTQKIHEDTHISRLHIQSIIHENYDGMGKVQYLGFISILEREYNIDLDDLKQNAIEHYDDMTEPLEEVNNILITPKKKRNFSSLYLIGGVLLLAGIIAYFSVFYEESTESVQDTVVEQEPQEFTPEVVVVEENLTQDSKDEVLEDSVLVDSNTTNDVADDKASDEVLQRSFIIKPRAKVWLGYKDMQSKKSYQKTFDDELLLDANKTWLLTFGHGYVDMIIDGKEIKFNDKKTMRFIYKDSNLTKITYQEFQKLNKDGEW